MKQTQLAREAATLHAGLIRGHADFRRLWIGDGISKIGSSVVVLAVPLLAATTLDASTWQVALLATHLHATFAVLFLAVRYAVEVLFLLRTAGQAPGVIGALIAVAGVGAVAGAVAANRIANRIGRTRTVLVTGLTVGGFSLLIPLTSAGAGLAFFRGRSGDGRRFDHRQPDRRHQPVPDPVP